MQLGFVSAIFGDLSLEEVVAFAADEGFACVELMCWPPGGPDRRYAGVSHVDVSNLTDERAAAIREFVSQRGIAISGLGYYPSPNLGLNFDPSHLIWQHIDYVRAIRAFAKRIIHVHAKDTRIDRDRLYATGILGLGWHTAKLPGLGEVDWGAFFAALTDAGYQGAVCIEVEDRAFEGSLADRKRSLRQSKRFLEQFVS